MERFEGPFDIDLVIRSDPKLLSCIRRSLYDYARCFGVPKEQAHRVVLAVNEACSNSIRHAYGNRRDRRLQLSLRCGESEMEIVLRDWGTTASAECFSEAEMKTPDASSVKPGGLGIPLIFTIFDEVEFKPGESAGNTLLMRLKGPGRKCAST